MKELKKNDDGVSGCSTYTVSILLWLNGPNARQRVTWHIAWDLHLVTADHNNTSPS